MKPTKPIKDYEKLKEDNKLFCGECDYGCVNKNSLKKHKIKDHKPEELLTDLLDKQECELCGQKFKTRTDLENHNAQAQTECYCTEDYTSEGCMYEGDSCRNGNMRYAGTLKV